MSLKLTPFDFSIWPSKLVELSHEVVRFGIADEPSESGIELAEQLTEGVPISPVHRLAIDAAKRAGNAMRLGLIDDQLYFDLIDAAIELCGYRGSIDGCSACEPSLLLRGVQAAERSLDSIARSTPGSLLASVRECDDYTGAAIGLGCPEGRLVDTAARRCRSYLAMTAAAIEFGRISGTDFDGSRVKATELRDQLCGAMAQLRSVASGRPERLRDKTVNELMMEHLASDTRAVGYFPVEWGEAIGREPESCRKTRLYKSLKGFREKGGEYKKGRDRRHRGHGRPMSKRDVQQIELPEEKKPRKRRWRKQNAQEGK